MGFMKLRFFPSHHPSWSHLRFPRAILNFSDFSWSYSSFKTTPRHLRHRELQIPGVLDARESKLSGIPDTTESKIPIVLDTGDSFFGLFLNFKST